MPLEIIELQKIFHSSGDNGYYEDSIQARFQKDGLTIYQNGGAKSDLVIRVNVEFDYRVE